MSRSELEGLATPNELCPNFLKGVLWGTTTRAIKGDTRSLDYCSNQGSSSSIYRGSVGSISYWRVRQVLLLGGDHGYCLRQSSPLTYAIKSSIWAMIANWSFRVTLTYLYLYHLYPNYQPLTALIRAFNSVMVQS